MRCQKTGAPEITWVDESIHAEALECWKEEGHLDAHEAVLHVMWGVDYVIVDEVDHELIEPDDDVFGGGL